MFRVSRRSIRARAAFAVLAVSVVRLALCVTALACTPVAKTIVPAEEIAGEGALGVTAGESGAGTITNGVGTGGVGVGAAAGGAATNGAAASGAAASGAAASGANPSNPSAGSGAGANSSSGPSASGGTAGGVAPPPNCMPTAETCDGIDNDCDGQTDEQVKKKCWADLDGDGVAAAMAEVTESCDECGAMTTPTAPGTLESIDCDDNDKTKAPGATDICGDGVDNDCNGTPDDKANNACDGPCTTQLPGKPGDPCSNGLKGACAKMGTYACMPDHSLTCSAEIVMGTMEKCGDNSDNDCDGVVDNSCVKNKCGGWTQLAPDKGDSCSMGEGTCRATGSYECDGTDKTVCSVQPKTPNDCGGCTPLPTYGRSCTATCSSDGQYVCNGTDATKCSVSAKPENRCGGCTILANDVGKTCTGACSARGSYICVPGQTDATTCSVTSTATRNSCGGCGSNPPGVAEGMMCTAGMNSCASLGHWSCTGAGDASHLECDAITQEQTNGCGGCVGERLGRGCVTPDASGIDVPGTYVCDGELTYCQAS